MKAARTGNWLTRSSCTTFRASALHGDPAIKVNASTRGPVAVLADADADSVGLGVDRLTKK